MRRIHSGYAALVLSFGALCGILRAAQAPQISTEASAHLTEIISALQKEWLHRDKMDWGTFRQRVFQQAGAAQTIPETYEAIRLGLTLLGDKHSHYVTAEGKSIFNPASPTQSTGECTPAAPVTPPLPAGVGYVRIQITPATSTAAIQEALRKGDGKDIVGWIVDLRNSRGGNMWPAMAGIGSLLGDGIAGFFVDAAKKATPWGYKDGEAWLDDHAVARVDAPYKMIVANPRVAVLTDIGVASSGEAVAIAFRGRPNTRSFGTPTCGLSTAVKQIPLSRGGQRLPFSQSARIAVVTSVMADRGKNPYGGTVPPDELVTEPADVVPRALRWLRGS